jgi:hypothetical protein
MIPPAAYYATITFAPKMYNGAIQRGDVDFGGRPNRGKDTVRTLGVEDQWMTAYVLVIVLAAGHHQPIAVGYPDQGSCLVAAERLRRNKKTHVECLKFVQGK